jgi:oligoribonuclease
VVFYAGNNERTTVNPKTTIPTKLLWIDLEMTGLDPEQDVILEVAGEVTNFQLETLDSFEMRIKQSQKTVLDRMQKNVFWQDYPLNRDDFVRGLDNAKPLAMAENELINLIEHHFGAEPVVLAGNSIYNDRLFIKRYLPKLELKLHYRMLDVSSFKILFQGRYNIDFKKNNNHRAFDDIQASIAELQYYLDWFSASNK